MTEQHECKRLEKFFAGQEKTSLIWRAEYWFMSMLVVFEIAKAVLEVAVSLNRIAIELRKTRLHSLQDNGIIEEEGIHKQKRRI